MGTTTMYTFYLLFKWRRVSCQKALTSITFFTPMRITVFAQPLLSNNMFTETSSRALLSRGATSGMATAPQLVNPPLVLGRTLHLCIKLVNKVHLLRRTKRPD